MTLQLKVSHTNGFKILTDQIQYILCYSWNFFSFVFKFSFVLCPQGAEDIITLVSGDNHIFAFHNTPHKHIHFPLFSLPLLYYLYNENAMVHNYIL